MYKIKGCRTMNPKVVVMDLGSTIIDNYEINFKRGFKYIYDNYCLHDVSFEDFIIDMDSIYINSFQKRDNDDFEINFHNYLRYMSNVVGFKEDVDYDMLERKFIDHGFLSSKVEGVEEFLKYVKKLGIDIYILSNSCLTGKALKYELSRVGLDGYFKEVFSSADYLMRKPNRLFFNIITKYLKRMYKDLDLKDVWYIGNDYKFDVFGACMVGLKSVWLNRNHEPNVEQFRCMDVPSYEALVDYLRRVNHDKV